MVELVVDGQSINHVGNCATEDGWAFADEDGPYDSLILCGSYCEQAAMWDEIAAEYYCDPG
jgi:hypothetical protein